MTRDDKIDIVLSDFYKERTISVPDYIYYKFGDPNDLESRKENNELIDFMCVNGLIKTETGYNYSIEPKGTEISESGGWKKYCEELSLQEMRRNEIEKKEYEKLSYETKLAKWQTKTFWPLFFLAIIGAIMGAISLIWQILENS